MSRATLYLDVDDTIIANCHKGAGFDLRPGVITQLRVLSRLFKVRWLTCWERRPVFQLVKLLYGGRINPDLTYANWGHGHPSRKAGYVLDPNSPPNWWWLEDPLCREELKALHDADKLDRYIRVEPYGNWAFLDGINELFRRAGIGEEDIKKVGGKLEWFNRESILAEDPTQENLAENLHMIKCIVESEGMSPEERVQQIQQYVQAQLDSLYPRKYNA